jgi:hypothetical protein
VPSGAVRHQPIAANCDDLKGPERSTCFSARRGALYVIRDRTVEQVQAFYLDQSDQIGLALVSSFDDTEPAQPIGKNARA